MNDKRIHAMIAIKSAEWSRRVIWAFSGYSRIGAEGCLDLHRVRLNRRRELFWPSWGAYGRRRRFVGAFAGASLPHPDFLFFS